MAMMQYDLCTFLFYCEKNPRKMHGLLKGVFRETTPYLVRDHDPGHDPLQLLGDQSKTTYTFLID